MSVALMPAGKKITKEFDVKLTVADLAEKAKAGSAINAEIMKLEDEFGALKSEYSAKISERYDKRREIDVMVASGKETRTLDVTMVKDFDMNLVQYWHQAEGGKLELIEERPLSDSERQMDIDDALGKSKPKKTAKDGRREDADKAEASKKKAKGAKVVSEIDEHIRGETNRKTKRSSVDGVYSR